MALTPASSRQLPDHAILDRFEKQTYLGNGYVVSTNLLSLATAGVETNILVLSNPSANFAVQASLGLFNNVRRGSCLSLSNGVIFRFYSNPVVSAPGTAIVPLNMRSKSNFVSVMTAGLSPTTSSRGAYFAMLATPNSVTDNSCWILDPGTSVLVTATSLANTCNLSFDAQWYEL